MALQHYLLTQEQSDNIYNAISVGMSVEDSYLFAGLPPHTLSLLQDDEEWQRTLFQTNKGLEYSLLSRMGTISDRQATLAKHEATSWLLEKLYPRYSTKTVSDVGTINLHLNDAAPSRAPEVLLPTDDSGKDPVNG